MTTRVTVSSQDDGAVVVTKLALQGDRADRRAEAQWLIAAAGPIVVPLLDYRDDQSGPGTDTLAAPPSAGPVIVTAHCGTGTLRTTTPSPAEAATMFATICDGLAELHDRDLVHGKVTLDHIVISGGHPRLCSPDGTATDPTTDLVGLGLGLRILLERWADKKVSVPRRSAWESLAAHLQTPDLGFTARRAARAFERLAGGDVGATKAPHQGPPPSRKRPELLSPPRVRGLAIAAGVVVVALGGIVIADRATANAERVEADSDAAVVDIGGALYQVGSADDAAVARPEGCSSGPAAFYLDGDDDTVWAFDSPESAPSAIATVPGATALEFRGSGCGELWALGPAGASLLRPELDPDR